MKRIDAQSKKEATNTRDIQGPRYLAVQENGWRDHTYICKEDGAKCQKY